jgi:hypothetical protein
VVKNHRVFISYHHANDLYYRNKLKRIACDDIIDGSVKDEDINPNISSETIHRIIRENNLRDTTVTLVLVGKETWKRKHVDWEIYSSLHRSSNKSRSGLLGVLLPSHRDYKRAEYDKSTIPPRLQDNIECGYAELVNWTTNTDIIHRKINAAFNRRYTYEPDLTRPLFINNLSGERWYS